MKQKRNGVANNNGTTSTGPSVITGIGNGRESSSDPYENNG
jgi:hypothetical protein